MVNKFNIVQDNNELQINQILNLIGKIENNEIYR